MKDDSNWIDYYEILEIDRTADQETIKRSYYELIKKFHPDICKLNNAHEKTSLINEAYEVLRDEAKKKEYDAIYDAKKNNSLKSVCVDDIDYEDIKKNYTDEEIEYARKISFYEIIKEEILKKIKVINSINIIKSDIKKQILSGNISSEEYYDTIFELKTIITKHIFDLKDLKKEASFYYKGSLYQIDDLISKLNEELRSPILSVEDIKIEEKKKKYFEIIESDMMALTCKGNEIIEKYKKLLINVYKNKLSEKDYYIFFEKLVPDIDKIIFDSERLIEFYKKMYMNEISVPLVNNFIECIGKLKSTKMNNLNYSEVIILGMKEYLFSEIKNIIKKCDTNISKIDRIEILLEKHPSSSLYEHLYIYVLDLLKETRESLMFEHNNFNNNNNFYEEAKELSAEANETFANCCYFSQYSYNRKKLLEIYLNAIELKTIIKEKDMVWLDNELKQIYDKVDYLDLRKRRFEKKFSIENAIVEEEKNLFSFNETINLLFKRLCGLCFSSIGILTITALLQYFRMSKSDMLLKVYNRNISLNDYHLLIHLLESSSAIFLMATNGKKAVSVYKEILQERKKIEKSKKILKKRRANNMNLLIK